MSVILTEAAAAEMMRVAAAEGSSPTVRARVRGGGCAGFTYELDFVDAPEIGRAHV